MIALAVFVAGAQGASPERQPAQPFEMKPAETVTIQGLRITFDGVSEDSRCPTGAQCVWAGDATAAFSLEMAPESIRRTLHTNSRFERQVEFAGFVIRLEDIKPYPRQGETIAPADYRATLIVTKR